MFLMDALTLEMWALSLHSSSNDYIQFWRGTFVSLFFSCWHYWPSSKSFWTPYHKILLIWTKKCLKPSEQAPLPLVNCPTQPTCIAQSDLCICQLYFITNPQWKYERNTAGQVATAWWAGVDFPRVTFEQRQTEDRSWSQNWPVVLHFADFQQMDWSDVLNSSGGELFNFFTSPIYLYPLFQGSWWSWVQNFSSEIHQKWSGIKKN